MKKTNVAVAVAAICVLSGCSPESLIEEGYERALEAESGEDVELDFDSEDGSFSIQTEDGEFSINADGETGNVEITGSETGEDGEESSFEITGEDGELQFESDEAEYSVGSEKPASFPSIPLPDAVWVSWTEAQTEEGMSWQASGESNGLDPETVFDAMEAEMSGYEVTARTTSTGFASLMFEGEHTVTYSILGEPGDTQIVGVTVFPPNG